MISQGISMDPSKVQTIFYWQPLTSIRDVQCYLGFSNFYWNSKVVLPLTELTRVNKKFMCSISANEAFDNLKKEMRDINSRPYKSFSEVIEGKEGRFRENCLESALIIQVV
jgi:hypothetical protein